MRHRISCQTRSGTSFTLGLFFACLLTIGLAPLAAHAQGEPNIMRWWMDAPSRNTTAPTRTYVPRQRAKPPIRPRMETDASLGLHMPDIAVTVPIRPDENRPVIGLVGDSLAEALALGFEADPAFKIDFLLRQKTSSASGLVRDDYLDWTKTVQALLTENKTMLGLVVMIGLNDRQILKQDAETFEPLTEGWRVLYRKRIDAILNIARAANVPVIWVGMPAMRLPKLSSDLMDINQIIQDRIAASGQTYLDITESFSGTDGKFSITGPDLIGDIVRLRGPDGIHFTPAGQRKLAFFVAKPLQRLAAERAHAVAILSPQPILAAPTSQTFPAPGGLTEVAPPVLTITPLPSFALPNQETTSFAPLLRVRPDIGEAWQLGEQRTATRLVDSARMRFDESSSRDLFDRGVAPSARSGRSDDFSWKEDLSRQ